VFVNARVAAVGEVSERGGHTGTAPSAATSICSPRTTRQAFFVRWREVPVYSLDMLQPGHAFAGPAIVEAETTTVIVGDGDRATVNALGWLDIALA
jgi:N-methylhydantoinase A